ncbi:hypothetical protein CIP107550_02432 [Corynebacterium diphtheriae]|nr:hypothetical protein CIP107550_02432 [Corynebacterium diphtheriae]
MQVTAFSAILVRFCRFCADLGWTTGAGRPEEVDRNGIEGRNASARGGGASIDELVVAVIADFEEVLTSLGEAVAVGETLRPKVLRPHAEPRGARADPVEDELDEGGAEAGLLVVGKEVETFELAVLGKDVRVGETAGAGQRVADGSAVTLDEPGGVVRVAEERFVFLQVVGFGVGKRGAANHRHGTG